MNILLIGSGGREHAMAWKISKSPKCEKLFIAPGNPGTAAHGQNVPIDVLDFPRVGEFVADNNIQMVVVGPEEPLVKGIADYFGSSSELEHVLFIGPGSEGAKLEGSKAFAKEFMYRQQIPTARYGSFTRDSFEQAREFLAQLQPPYVLKADGLAAGKGVIISDNLPEAEQALDQMLISGMFGAASDTVVIEEFLKGRELSVFALTDGINYKLLPEAKDYKRIGEGDTGPNTGGMGAVSPVAFADKDFMQKVEQRIVIPTVEGLKKENINYIGFIFFGLIDVDGDPFVIEYNVRMGDPETEVVIPRIDSDLVELFEAAAKQTLDKTELRILPDAAATVMMVSGGYPGGFQKGFTIKDLDKVSGSQVFLAGVRSQQEELVTSGGRVMAITSIDKSLELALEKSYMNAERIDFFGKYYRRDIGKDLLK
jgi:phosphoribosylamine---glycine ligase